MHGYFSPPVMFNVVIQICSSTECIVTFILMWMSYYVINTLDAARLF